jgi:hypothetical protein
LATLGSGYFQQKSARLPFAALPVRLPTTPSSPPTTLQQLLDAKKLDVFGHPQPPAREIVPLARRPGHGGRSFGLPPVIQIPRKKKSERERALDALPNGDRELLAEALYEQYRKAQAKNAFGDLEEKKQG